MEGQCGSHTEKRSFDRVLNSERKLPGGDVEKAEGLAGAQAQAVHGKVR